MKIAVVPAAWHFYALSAGAMVMLAGLDFAGSILAKEWTERHHAGYYLAGLAAFVLLYVVYAASLRFAELTTVTFGWVVLLQVGIVLIDTQRYGLSLPPGKWLAVGGLLALQGYLLLGPNGDAS
ncbi:MAG TPA: hypothetical protein VKZ96_00495 [Thermomicrobiales bacterium]|nr:hypothetical protein [Thermomicrobiales bacterium]